MLAVRELVRSRDLFVTLVQRQLWLRTKRSWMSTVWPVATPFVLMALYVYVFRRVFHVPIARYPEFLLCGLIPWTFFTQVASRSLPSISAEPEMVRRAPFPYALLPLSSAAALAVNLLLSVTALSVYLALVGSLHVMVLPLLIPPLIAVMLLGATAAMVLSLADVYNHDVRHFVPHLLTGWFFLLPILYRPSMVPRSMRFVRFIDPMNMVVTAFRDVLYRGQAPAPITSVALVMVTGAVFVIVATLFRREAADLAKDV